MAELSPSSGATSAPSKWPPALLAAAGILLSVVLELVHLRAYLDPTTASFCAVGGSFDCDTVALSRFSVVLGVPLPIWGAAGFVAMLIAALRRSRLLLPLAAVSALASVALLLEELLHIGSVCVMCEGVHLIAIMLLLVAWRQRHVTRPTTAKTAALELALPALIVIVAGLVVPPYWSLVSWKSGVRYAHGVDEEGREWIGAEDPKVTVVEYVDYGCPHCAVAASKMRMLVAEHPNEIRLVRHHQPRMRCKLGSQCQYARAAICAAKQDLFWQMDDWLFRHAAGHEKTDLEQAAVDVGFDHAALVECMDKPETYAEADTYASAARKAKIRSVPGYIVDGEQLPITEVHATILESL
ncbi:Vitamin K epoxide reductase family protein [Enhygromyxa salina]|uniref:Vitamin K epoxide reductase family protein n=1 Tax=Enhygromyxa salina TaxID=215803 RepID=A0A2S9YCX0_9BACT|nr:vitamin K epoxide reductase family protein [Enhygromyxa salina]PRQ02851.1 Vitamin K epoxide reductase family protein [Enhygromyxa salina]